MIFFSNNLISKNLRPLEIIIFEIVFFNSFILFKENDLFLFENRVISSCTKEVVSLSKIFSVSFKFMFEKIISNTSTIVVGNSEKIKLTLAAIVSEGSILIEDYPGSGKTTFAKAITQSLGLNFKRVQFTSDLLPSDILGFNIFLDGKLNFQKGPIFTNIVLADELNRGSPKSQSAFLEAMEEKKVSIDGISHSLPEPFL